MTDFFKHGNKVYSENLNDGILVGNSFDWTVNISLPGDTGGVFPNTTTVVKAKVADVYATPNSNLSIGETITNNAGSSQVYRLTVYPNFNRFGGFTFVSLEGDGDVIITEVGASSPIRNNLDYSNLGDVVELKQLKEYDIVVTIPSGGVVTGLGFGFKSSSADVTASINQSNVTGLESDLSGIHDDLSSLESGKADVGHLHTTAQVASQDALGNIGTSAGATQRMINEAVDEMVGSLDTFTNMIEIHAWDIPAFSLASGGGVQKTVTVPNPSGYYRVPLIQGAYKCYASSLGLSGTTLTVNIQNHYSTNANASMYGIVLYIKSSIITEI